MNKVVIKILQGSVVTPQ